LKTSSQVIILSLIFIICVAPTIYIYFEHASIEKDAYYESLSKANEYKATKQLGEAILFFGIAFGYLLTSIAMLLRPNNEIPYLIILVGTVAIIIVYYMRIYGIPIPFTDIIIRDITTDWRDVVTKICQQILVIPVAILFAMRKQI